MSNVKAIILCNNPIGLLGIKEFLFYGNVGALVTTKRNKEMQMLLHQLTAETNMPVIVVDKKTYEDEIATAIKKYGITVGLVLTLYPSIFLSYHKKDLSIFITGFCHNAVGLNPFFGTY
jgi:hypothetical protein